MNNRTEGDINSSPLREAWHKALPEETLALLEEDEKYFIRQNLSTPCLDVAAQVEGSCLINQAGKKYLDFHGNSVHQVGYNNPSVVEALQQQLQELSFSPRRYTNRKAIQLAQKLCGYFSKPYKVLFTPSGSASISIALKMARMTTGRHKTISLWNAFHGANLDAISVGGEGLFRGQAGPLLPGTEHIMPYNSYRCVFGDCQSCQLKCLDYLAYILETEGDIGAIIMETIRCTDVHIPPPEYFQRLRELCTSYGALLILDEIPIGLGRTGKMFAYMHYSIEPDILVLGKGLGGSLIPMSAVIAKEELDILPHISLGHYTHEKNPLGSATALAALNYIEEHQLLEKTQQLGAYAKARLLTFKDTCPLIGDVRGIGLLLAVELVTSQEQKTKATEEAEKILYKCLDRGLSFKISQGNILTLAPPLTISKAELDQALAILEQAIQEVSGELFSIK